MFLKLNLLSITNFKLFLKSCLCWLVIKILSKKIIISFGSENIGCFSENFIFLFRVKIRRSVNLFLKIFYKCIIVVLVLFFCIWGVWEPTISFIHTKYSRFLIFILSHVRKVLSWVLIIYIAIIILVLKKCKLFWRIYITQSIKIYKIFT